MLFTLATSWTKEGKKIRIVQALSNVRDLLRKQGVEEITGHIGRAATITEAVKEFNSA